MIAIVQQLGSNSNPTTAQLDAAGNAAFEWVPNVYHVRMIAEHFKISAVVESYKHDALEEIGLTHWETAKAKGDARKAGQATSTSGLSSPRVEGKIALAPYKRDMLRTFQPILDQGKQVVVGQWNHFVRLQAVDEQGVALDDPGWWNRSNVRQTWEEARALGLFEYYLVLG